MTHGWVEGAQEIPGSYSELVQMVSLALPAREMREQLHEFWPDGAPFAAVCLLNNHEELAVGLAPATLLMVLLGSLEAWAEKCLDPADVARWDQLQALRADARARWADSTLGDPRV